MLEASLQRLAFSRFVQPSLTSRLAAVGSYGQAPSRNTGPAVGAVQASTQPPAEHGIRLKLDATGHGNTQQAAAWQLGSAEKHVAVGSPQGWPSAHSTATPASHSPGCSSPTPA